MLSVVNCGLLVLWVLVNRLIAQGRYEVTDDANERLQSFPVNYSAEAQYIVVNITNNHGNQDYTCLYRVLVHGHPTVSKSM
jgi:hypothetical protein